MLRPNSTFLQTFNYKNTFHDWLLFLSNKFNTIFEYLRKVVICVTLLQTAVCLFFAFMAFRSFPTSVGKNCDVAT